MTMGGFSQALAAPSGPITREEFMEMVSAVVQSGVDPAAAPEFIRALGESTPGEMLTTLFATADGQESRPTISSEMMGTALQALTQTRRGPELLARLNSVIRPEAGAV